MGETSQTTMDRKEELTARFNKIDVNSNGKLEKSELASVFGEYADEFLKFCDDGEKDGQLTTEEFCSGIEADVKDLSDDDFKATWLDRMDGCIAEAAAAPAAGALKNKAFLFIKPHAVTDATKTMAAEALAAKGFSVLESGVLTAAEIDEKKLIDNHYYAIASKATILKPNELNVPADKFEGQFGLSWEDALAGGRVFNAMDGCADLGLTADQLDKKWGECKKAGKLIKFGGGFYCGLIEVEGKEPAYIFNGFFMSMRAKYVAEGCSIFFFVVEWDASTMSWSDFREKGLGPTDPVTAPEDSVRGMIYKDWEQLGLSAVPDVGDNGMHGSASPFEGLAELMNWRGCTLESQEFGAKLLESGISAETIKAWSVDPQVTLPGADATGSLFDAVEDMNADDCLAKLVAINAANQ